MGEAILAGVIASGAWDPADIAVTNIDATRLDQLSDHYGVGTYIENIDALPADIVLLTVKPQVMDAVLAEIGPHLADTLVVSVAAGIDTLRIARNVADSARIVRVMPNTPAMVGKGMSIVSGADGVDDDDVATVAELFSSVGEVVTLPESLQNAAMSISGSGPAYFEQMVELLASSGVRHGLDRDVAERLAIATMAGTAELMSLSGKTPTELIAQVTSPGGTTRAALDAMERGGLHTAIASGVDAAIARALELAEE